jgi:hypothetical protein
MPFLTSVLLSNLHLLEYSSWAFQLVAVLAILYLVVGLINPQLVRAKSRSTIWTVGIAVLLVASTAFYLAIRPLNSMPDGAGVSTADGAQPAPLPSAQP